MSAPYTGQPGGQPAPAGWGPPPQTQPQQPPPQAGWQQPPMPPQLDPNMRIPQGDPRYPRELWGRTIAEGMQFYNIMRKDFTDRNGPGQQPPPQQAPRGWTQPQQPFGQPQPIPTLQQPGVPVYDPNAGQAPTGFGADQVRQIFREEIGRFQAPMVATTMETVRNNVASGLPDWNSYAADIHVALQGAPPEMLMNPDSWRMAYFAVKGRRLTEQPVAAAPPPPVDPFRRNGQGANGGGQGPQPGYQPPPQQQPQQPFGGQVPGGPSFTEAPVNTAPYNPNVQPDDPRDIIMAQKFGIPLEEYRAYKGGNIPPMPQPQVPAGYPQPGQPQPAWTGMPQRW